MNEMNLNLDMILYFAIGLFIGNFILKIVLAYFLSLFKKLFDLPHWELLIKNNEGSEDKTVAMVNLNSIEPLVRQINRISYFNLKSYIYLEVAKFKHEKLTLSELKEVVLNLKSEDIEDYFLYLRNNKSSKTFFKKLSIFQTIKEFEKILNKIKEEGLESNFKNFKSYDGMNFELDMVNSMELCNKMKKIIFD